MRLPRNVSGQKLADALCLTTMQEGEHHVTIPLHDPLRIGTFAGILLDVTAHFGLTHDELLLRLKL